MFVYTFSRSSSYRITQTECVFVGAHSCSEPDLFYSYFSIASFFYSLSLSLSCSLPLNSYWTHILLFSCNVCFVVEFRLFVLCCNLCRLGWDGDIRVACEIWSRAVQCILSACVALFSMCVHKRNCVCVCIGNRQDEHIFSFSAFSSLNFSVEECLLPIFFCLLNLFPLNSSLSNFMSKWKAEERERWRAAKREREQGGLIIHVQCMK